MGKGNDFVYGLRQLRPSGEDDAALAATSHAGTTVFGPRLSPMKLRAMATAVLMLCAVATAPVATAATAALKCSPATAKPHAAPVFKQPRKMLKAKTYIFTFKTNCGTIKVAADARHAPITVRNLAFLAGKKYFNNTLCHRLTTAGIYILQCGDPTTTGYGSPGFQYADENLPTKMAKKRYPAGTVAMANGGPGTNGSQFFLVYKDANPDLPASYTIWGHITAGLDILKAIAAKGTRTGSTDGPPAQALSVISVTVSEGTP